MAAYVGVQIKKLRRRFRLRVFPHMPLPRTDETTPCLFGGSIDTWADQRSSEKGYDLYRRRQFSWTWLGMDWLGILGLFVGVIGTSFGVFGVAWGIWLWLDSKRKGDVMIGFLHGLKTGELNPLQLEQVNDILARFDPPRKARCLLKKNTVADRDDR